MVLKQEELISRYLDHAMSAEEEQHFLIKLAASDDMRIAFRSHLELMRAVRDDKDELRSVARVRTRTLAALGLSAAAVTPFIEQELVRSAKNQPQEASTATTTAGSTATTTAGSTATAPQELVQQVATSTPWYSRFAGLLHSRSMVLGTGLMLGFSGAVVLMNVTSDENSQLHGAAHQAISRQLTGEQTPAQTTAPSVSAQSAERTATAAGPDGMGVQQHGFKAANGETISEQDGLHNTARTETHGVASGVRATATPGLASKSPSSVHPKPMVVDKSNPGEMRVNPLTIHTPNDSEKAR